MNAIRTFNVEAGLTTLDKVRRLLATEIKTANLNATKHGVTVLWLK